MKGIFRGIFISLALLAGSGLRGWCATLEFIDSLRTELERRNMPERVLFLPLALADQRGDDGREGIWSLTALDAIRGEALCRKTATESDKGTGDVAKLQAFRFRRDDDVATREKFGKFLSAMFSHFRVAVEIEKANADSVDDVRKLQTPVYQADLTAIQRSFMNAVQAVKKEFGNDLQASRELTAQAAKKIYAELTKGQHKPNRKITPEQIGEAVAQSVSHLPGVDTELVKQMFLAMAGTVTSNEKGSNDQ